MVLQFVFLLLTHAVFRETTTEMVDELEPPASCSWFGRSSKIVNILTSFLWSIRVHTIENCCRFVKCPLLTKCFVNMAGYWPSWALYFYGPSLIRGQQKRR